MMGRDDAQAREAFQAVEKAGTKGFAKNDVDLANFFVATAKTLSSPGVIPSSRPLVKGPSSHEVFALLPFALKDISRLDVQDAALLLDQFVTAQPAGKFAWIAELKPVAQKYLDDCRVYLNWKSQPKPTPALDLRKRLKTRSALADEMSGLQKQPAPSTAPA